MDEYRYPNTMQGKQKKYEGFLIGIDGVRKNCTGMKFFEKAIAKRSLDAVIKKLQKTPGFYYEPEQAGCELKADGTWVWHLHYCIYEL